MKKILMIFIGLFCLLHSCIDHTKEKEWLKSSYYDGPTTQKERDYLNELRSEGFINPKFYVPVIDRTPTYGGFYKLTLGLKKSIDSTNLDSIKKVQTEIANYLYTDIIADSTLMSINEIIVNIEVAKGYYVTGEKPFLYETYYKDSLARKHNFKVVRVGNNIYDRIPYWQKVK